MLYHRIYSGSISAHGGEGYLGTTDNKQRQQKKKRIFLFVLWTWSLLTRHIIQTEIRCVTDQMMPFMGTMTDTWVFLSSERFLHPMLCCCCGSSHFLVSFFFSFLFFGQSRSASNESKAKSIYKLTD